MADFRLTKPKQKKPPSDETQAGGIRLSKRAENQPRAAREPLSPEASRSLLSQAGGAAASGLHTIGSILSTPSRVLWGTLNGIAGGEGGFGNMNPLDSTGGIELSHVLGNAGLIAKNDPSRWEWGDLGRGLVDITGDPTSWMGVGGLTKAGVAASKSSAGVTRGFSNAIREGERGLISFHHPLSSVSRGAVGTGESVADAVEQVAQKTGASKAATTLAQSAPVRYGKALMQSSMKGKTHAEIQKHAAEIDSTNRSMKNAIDKNVYALALRHKKEGFAEPGHAEMMRDALEQVPGLSTTTDHHGIVNDMVNLKNAMHAADKKHGIRTGDLVDDDVAHFPRYISEGVDLGTSPEFSKASRSVPTRDDVWKQLGGTNSINRLLTNKHTDSVIKANASLPIDAQVAAATQSLIEQHPKFDAEKLGAIAAKMVGTPKLREQGLFGNHPLHDLRKYMHHWTDRQTNAELMYRSMAGQLGQPGQGQTVRQFLQGVDMDPEIGAATIARILGRNTDSAATGIGRLADAENSGIRRLTNESAGQYDDILNQTIPDDLAGQLRSLTPGYTSPPADTAIADALKSLTTVWKASTLAHPATRVRDAVSGVVQNALMGHSAAGGWNEARNIALNRPLARSYEHLPEVKSLMDRHGLTHDEAVQAILAAEAPRTSGAVADVAPGTVGAGIQDILHQIPGQQKQSGLIDVLKTAAKSLRHGELDRAGNPIGGGSVLNPLNVAGAFGREHTRFGPAAASNVVAGATDEFNRHAGILGQMGQDFNPSVAGKATRAAQVDYAPDSYSAFERNRLKTLMPFYSFNARMMGHTARELAAHPGGRTAQVIKAQDRSQARDASLPDSVQDSTALQMGTLPDGTKRLLTGLGLAHESAVKTLGSAVGGDLAGAGYDSLGMLSPLLRNPLEGITGQSFYQRGEPSRNLESNVGRTLANLGVMAGVRDKDAGPISYPGSSVVDAALNLSPVSRYASTIRSLTDTRKDMATKALNTLTGVKVTDVSPKRQTYELMKKAEKLAKANGGHVRSEVYFSKKDLEKIAKTDPEMAKKQQELQGLLRALNGRSGRSGGSKSASGKKKNTIRRMSKKKKPSTKVKGLRFQKREMAQ